MRLNEIKDQTGFKTISDWVKLNASESTVHDVLANIKELRSGSYCIQMNHLFLNGNGQPFSKPDNLIIRALEHITFSNYDFENSDYGFTGTINAYSVSLEYGPKCDLVKVFQRTSSLSFDKIYVTLKMGEFTNLVPATEMVENAVITAAGGEPLRKLFISTRGQFVNTGGKKHDYKDAFDLQEILINNGFEDLV
ncbi:hypothetical protein RsoM2USA_302 [Ralstonia phage RsoM2USA]|nr:hypothetical protein RsoM2USA_302 [Ralstonia phage RsoM2USA]